MRQVAQRCYGSAAGGGAGDEGRADRVLIALDPEAVRRHTEVTVRPIPGVPTAAEARKE